MDLQVSVWFSQDSRTRSHPEPVELNSGQHKQLFYDTL